MIERCASLAVSEQRRRSLCAMIRHAHESNRSSNLRRVRQADDLPRYASSISRKTAVIASRCYGCNALASEPIIEMVWREVEPIPPTPLIREPTCVRCGAKMRFHALRRRSQASCIMSTNARNAGARRASSLRSRGCLYRRNHSLAGARGSIGTSPTGVCGAAVLRYHDRPVCFCSTGASTAHSQKEPNSSGASLTHDMASRTVSQTTRSSVSSFPSDDMCSRNVPSIARKSRSRPINSPIV